MSCRVLVVDDDPGIRATLAAVLEWQDYDVVLAEDGLAALERLGERAPALILLDLMMPRMDGYAFVEELRRRQLAVQIPIILITASGQAAQKAHQMGVAGFLEKPFELDDVLDRVAHLMSAGCEERQQPG